MKKTKMKEPLQALLIAAEEQMWIDLLEGRKRISLREGHRAYRTSEPIMLCCHEGGLGCVMADVTEVRHTSLNKITEEEYRADGFESRAQMLEQMRRFYPNLNMRSAMTVIRWTNVRGDMVDFLAKN